VLPAADENRLDRLLRALLGIETQVFKKHVWDDGPR
jgi:hypothetical protein